MVKSHFCTRTAYQQHSPNEPNLEDDDHVFLSHGSDDYKSGSSLLDDDSIASEESFGSAESVRNYGCADTPESPVESDNSSFTTAQKCAMSLMYLLDDMECPDYAWTGHVNVLKPALTLIQNAKHAWET